MAAYDGPWCVFLNLQLWIDEELMTDSVEHCNRSIFETFCEPARLLHFAHTHKYHPKSRNVLHCIIVFIIVFICYDPVLVPGILKQCDIQYNRKRNTLTTSPKKHNPRPPIFISDFREKTSPKSLIISRLGNCSLCVQMADWCGTC